MSELSMGVMVKLASLVIHTQERFSLQGHTMDDAACKSLANDAEVQAWLDSLDPVLLPVKR